MSKALHMENVSKAQAAVAAAKPLLADAVMRQRYHFMAEEGWINDPNGLIFFRGQYHYFYQYNPYDAFWGAMHWGHAVSDDLLNWKYLPVALAPSESYDNHEKGGCFSGSAIEYEGRLYLFYTGTAHDGSGFVQTQCMACSDDGVTFEKYQHNPVIMAPPGYARQNFRDPKVWRHKDCFYMVCGGQKDNLAAALLYRSDDLRHWAYVNVLFESRGEYGTMFECPDFYPLGDKYVFTFSPMGLHQRTCVYLVGNMDYKAGKFHPINMGEIDWGFDYYAPQSFLDAKGRRLVVAWANAWDWMPWWKDWGPTYQERWCGAFNLPRQVRLMPDNTLQFVPVEELQELRSGKQEYFDIHLHGTPFSITAGDGIAFETKLVLDLCETTAHRIWIKLRKNEERETLVCIDLQRAELSVNRDNSDGWSSGCSTSPLDLKDKRILDIHLFSDQSSIELFSAQYQNNHSCNVFAGNSQRENYIVAEDGTAVFKSICSWGLKTVMDNPAGGGYGTGI